MKTHFSDFIDWQIAEGSNGLVPCGTTGEARRLIPDEHRRVVEIAVEVAQGPGAGDRRLRQQFDRSGHRDDAQSPRKSGADAALVVAALLQQAEPGRACSPHFRAVAEASTLPIIVYNVPSRTDRRHLGRNPGRDCRSCPNIVGVKDATGNLGRVTAQRLACGEEFCPAFRQ